MINSKLLSISFICALSISLPAQAKLYKWVDDKGTTHYGEVIPPEYANKDRTTIKKSGLEEKQAEKTDPAALKAKEEAAAKRAETKEKMVEEQRRNNTLLNTYSNEKEIDMARERSLILVKARIDSNSLLVQSTQESLAQLNKEVEERTKAGKTIPASLKNEIEQTTARSKRYANELANSEAELEVIKKRFDEDKELYRQLKGQTVKK